MSESYPPTLARSGGHWPFASGFSSGPAPGRKAGASTAWMITFTDLVALMLTFFVLLFAMSQIQQQKWKSIVESLASDQSATQRLETAKLVADYQVEAEIAPPGADLDYLEPILREHLASDPLFANATMDRGADGLTISFPGERLFADQATDLTARGEKIIFALGSVLRNLHNAIDVNASLVAEDVTAATNWGAALSRSVAIVRMLAQSGFAGPIVARVGADAPGTFRSGHGDGIDLLVREDQR